MAVAIACPTAEKFQQLSVGDASTAEMEQFASHLEECSACAQRMDGIVDQSILVKALRANTPSNTDDGRLGPLMAKLAKLADPYPTDAAHTPNPCTAAISTDPGVQAGIADTEINFSKLLSPAKEPGEMGWLGPYRVLKVLGHGGMGVVFQAEDTKLKRHVALKAMLPHYATSLALRQRFLREAQAAAKVHHDHVVVIHQAGEESGTAYLAMELLEGETLEARLCRAENGPLPLAETLRIGREIAEGLAAAHEHGLIHRDIKPNNIWLQQRGEGRKAKSEQNLLLAPRPSTLVPRVKILDFGVARAADEDGKLTTAGAIVGTPAYMSPEQANAGPVDSRTDLFSLGCVLYRMCTGVVPFPGSSALQILRAVAEHQPKSPRELNPTVPAELSALVIRLLEKDSTNRIASATEVVSALRHMENDLAGRAEPRRGPSEGSPRRRKPLVLVGIASLLGLAIFIFVFSIIRFPTPEGDIVINTDDPNFTFSRDKDGNVILTDQEKKREYKVKAVKQKDGGVVLEVIDPGSDLVFHTTTFSIRRGDTVVVKAWFERKRDVESPPIPAGEPMSALALVTKPAKIAGVKSWTIETKWPRGGFNNFAFNPGGENVAMFDSNGAVRFFNRFDGRLEQVLVGPGAAGSTALAWSKDGKFLAARSDRHQARQIDLIVWDVAAGKKITGFNPAEGTDALAWSPHGKYLANGGTYVELWDPLRGITVGRFAIPGKPGRVKSLAWSSDGKTLAGANEDGEVWLWDTGTAEVLHHLKGDGRKGIASLSWSPDSSRLVHYSPVIRPKMTIWSAKTGKVESDFELDIGPHWGGEPIYFTWGKDGKTMSGLWAPKGYWDAETKKWTRPLQPKNFLGLNPAMKSTPSMWSPDGKVWVGVHGGLWSVETGKRICDFNSNPEPNLNAENNAMQAPDGKYFAMASDDNIVRLVDPKTGEILKSLSAGIGNKVAGLYWSPDGKRLLIFRNNVYSSIFDIQKNEAYRTGDGANSFNPVWSNDSKVLAIGGPSGTVVLYDAESGKEVHRFTDKGIKLYHDAAFSPKVALLALSDDKGIRLYDLAKKAPTEMEIHPDCRSLAWSPDGTRIAAGCGSIAVWNVEMRKITHKLENAFGHHIDGPLVWSPDGKTISGQDHASNVCYWDAVTGKLLSKKGGIGRTDYIKAPSSPFRFVALVNDQFIAISPEGHYRGTPKAEREIVYVVETEHGQETLTPAEMEKKYGWKNDPDKLRLTP